MLMMMMMTSKKKIKNSICDFYFVFLWMGEFFWKLKLFCWNEIEKICFYLSADFIHRI